MFVNERKRLKAYIETDGIVVGGLKFILDVPMAGDAELNLNDPLEWDENWKKVSEDPPAPPDGSGKPSRLPVVPPPVFLHEATVTPRHRTEYQIEVAGVYPRTLVVYDPGVPVHKADVLRLLLEEEGTQEQPAGLGHLVQLLFRHPAAREEKRLVALGSQYQCEHGNWFAPCSEKGKITFVCVAHALGEEGTTFLCVKNS